MNFICGNCGDETQNPTLADHRCNAQRKEDHRNRLRGINIYPQDMTRDQWRKWVACQAMKGMIGDCVHERIGADGKETELDILIDRSYKTADAFITYGDKNVKWTY